MNGFAELGWPAMFASDLERLCARTGLIPAPRGIVIAWRASCREFRADRVGTDSAGRGA